jgi:uncharacterized protein YuzE
MDEFRLAYVKLREVDITATVEVTPSTMVDLDSKRRIVGIETLDGSDWADVLAQLAMQGRLVVLKADSHG